MKIKLLFVQSNYKTAVKNCKNCSIVTVGNMKHGSYGDFVCLLSKKHEREEFEVIRHSVKC